jgi:hypothetical protein
MKKLFLIMAVIFLTASLSFSQNTKSAKDPAGQWNFSAPYAPEGYTSGTVAVTFAEKKYGASMAFTGLEYKFTGENVKFANDTLSFSIYIEGETINVTLKMEDALKMAGSAVYSGGSVPLTLSKEVKEKK